MIHPQYQDQVTVQEYMGAGPQIDGVEVVVSPYHNDDGGNFAEVLRSDGKEVEGLKSPFVIKQLSMSVMVPKVIKAYHLHKRQDDLWFVSPYDRLLVNLHDVREGSKTFDTHMRLVIGGGKNMILRIPKGVAHGVANPYDKRMTLIYATSEQFNAKDSDEYRLPWDVFGKEVWDLVKG